MPLNLNDLIKKAKDKGIEIPKSKNSNQIIKPWQQESILFVEEKLATNRQQSGNKPITNQQQSDNKAATIENQSQEKNNKTDNKPATQPTTLSATKWQQIDNKVATNHCFSSLVDMDQRIEIFAGGKIETIFYEIDDPRFARGCNNRSVDVAYEF